MKIFILILAAALCSVLPVTATEITNFRSGLVCSDGKDLIGVCHLTEDVYITGQSTCVWNGENKPCTWYGFSFDYKKTKPGTDVVCEFKTSQNIVDGNPKEILRKGTNSGEYSFKLENVSGHFFNPQYFLFSGYSNISRSLITTETVCSIEGKQIFR